MADPPAPSTRERVGWLLVALQMLLLGALVVAGVVGLTGGAASDSPGLAAAGALLVVGGAGLALLGITGLGSALRANPVPSRSAELRTDGAYAWVRHPIYTGLLAVSAGWVLAVRTWPVAVVAVALVCLLVVKARWEEALLVERFPGYEDYAARTPRFVPRRPRRAGAAA